MFTKLTRIATFAVQNFWRNFWLSMATISIITLSFLSVNFFILGNLFLDTILTGIENRVNVTVYFRQSAPEDAILKIADSLRGLPSVNTVEYVSRDMALERLKKSKVTKDNLIQDTVQAIGSNPLNPSLIIRAKTVADYPTINAYLGDPQYESVIEKRNFADREVLIQRVDTWKQALRKIGIFVNIFFAFIAALIVFNAIRISIYTRRKEVGIMKLVGATNWFVRGPLLLEAALYSVVAIVLTTLIFYPMLGIIQPFVDTHFDGQALDVLKFFSDNFFYIFGYELLASIAINVISTSLAIGRYLKV